ncbi:DNA polymerase III subunit delta', partial [Acinetobacter sp. V2]
DRISYEQATSYLNEHLSEIAEVQPDLLLGLSNDMPLQAIEIAKSDWFTKRQTFLNDWLKIVAQKNMPLFFSGKWQKELSFSDFIVLFEYLLGDLICVKLNQPQKNTDLDFDQLSPYYDLESLFNIYSELQQAKKLVEQNVQSQLIIDQLFITLMNV